MTDRDDLLQQIAADVRALVEPYDHDEPYPVHEVIKGKLTLVIHKHPTRHPSLLDQLGEAVEQSTSAEDGKRAFGSKPTARLEAVDKLLQIDAAAAMWLNVRLGRPLRPTIAANLRGLVGEATRIPRHEQLEALGRDVHRWLVWAQVVTGWDSPPWKPNVACPVCDEKGTLRVRLVRKTALCTDCNETWDEATIGLLADHCRDTDRDVARVLVEHWAECCWCGVDIRWTGREERRNAKGDLTWVGPDTWRTVDARMMCDQAPGQAPVHEPLAAGLEAAG